MVMLPGRGGRVRGPKAPQPVHRIEELGDGCYRVTSGRSGTEYKIITDEGKLKCPCPGYGHRQACSHTQQVSNVIAAKATGRDIAQTDEDVEEVGEE